MFAKSFLAIGLSAMASYAACDPVETCRTVTETEVRYVGASDPSFANLLTKADTLGFKTTTFAAAMKCTNNNENATWIAVLDNKTAGKTGATLAIQPDLSKSLRSQLIYPSGTNDRYQNILSSGILIRIDTTTGAKEILKPDGTPLVDAGGSSLLDFFGPTEAFAQTIALEPCSTSVPKWRQCMWDDLHLGTRIGDAAALAGHAARCAKDWRVGLAACAPIPGTIVKTFGFDCDFILECYDPDCRPGTCSLANEACIWDEATPVCKPEDCPSGCRPFPECTCTCPSKNECWYPYMSQNNGEWIGGCCDIVCGPLFGCPSFAADSYACWGIDPDDCASVCQTFPQPVSQYTPETCPGNDPDYGCYSTNFECYYSKP